MNKTSSSNTKTDKELEKKRKLSLKNEKLSKALKRNIIRRKGAAIIKNAEGDSI